MSNELEKDALEEILRALRDEDAAVRENAIQQLQKHSNSVCDDSEFEGLSDAEIMEVLDKRRTQWLQQSRIVEVLLLAIDDSSVRVRSKTTLLLGNVIDLRAQDALIRHLRDDPSSHVRRMCAAALNWTPTSAQKVDGFIAALKDQDWGISSLACSSLGRAGDGRAIEPLYVAMTNPAWRVQFCACEALITLHAVDLAVVNLLEKLDQEPEAKEHNEMIARVNEISEKFDPSAAERNPDAGTTSRVLEQARRLLQ